MSDELPALAVWLPARSLVNGIDWNFGAGLAAAMYLTLMIGRRVSWLVPK